MYSVLRVSLIVIYALIVFTAGSQNRVKADSIRMLIQSKDLPADHKLEAYYWLSTYSNSPEEKLKYGKLLLELAKQSDNQQYQIMANLRIGVAHRFLGNLGEALAYLFESANDATEREEFIPLLAKIYAEISTCYTQNGDSENALLYGSKTIEILRTTNQEQELALTLLNTGYDYYLIGNYDSAMSYYNESEPILEEIGMTIGLAYIIGNRALVYWKSGDNEKAKEDLGKAIEMLEPLGDRFGMADYYNQLGTIFLEEEDHSQAIIHTMKGLEMAKEEGLKEQVRDASYLLFSLHQNAGAYEKAIEYQTQYYTYKDSIQNHETTQQIANLRTGFEVGQKQAEVDLLLEHKRNNQIIMIMGSIALFIVLGLAALIYYYSRSKMRLNAQLEEQKDSLLALNNTKDKFFSIISHDLRGPVSALSGLVGVTKYYLDDKKPELLGDMIGKMEKSVDNLVKLLDNLLQWALQQRGHFPYLPERASLKGMLTDVNDMFMDTAAAKNIKLDLEMKEDLDLFIDKNTTSAIFRNVLNNAIKFTPDGGHIQVSAEKNGKADFATIKFVDNGVGIPDDKLKKLFKLNSKITTRGTSGESGLGLGLQLVYDFIALNKGEIAVESKEGKGTTFAVHLPLHNN